MSIGLNSSFSGLVYMNGSFLISSSSSLTSSHRVKSASPFYVISSICRRKEWDFFLIRRSRIKGFFMGLLRHLFFHYEHCSLCGIPLHGSYKRTVGVI